MVGWIARWMYEWIDGCHFAVSSHFTMCTTLTSVTFAPVRGRFVSLDRLRLQEGSLAVNSEI